MLLLAQERDPSPFTECTMFLTLCEQSMHGYGAILSSCLDYHIDGRNTFMQNKQYSFLLLSLVVEFVSVGV
jgi:hypothetical protein